MTRFLFTLSDAVDTIIAAIGNARPAETFVPDIVSGRIIDIAQAMLGGRNIEVQVIGTRPGEKLHETLVSAEESTRTARRDGYFVIRPMLPEIAGDAESSGPIWEFTSGDKPLDYGGVRDLLYTHRLLDFPATELHTHELSV